MNKVVLEYKQSSSTFINEFLDDYELHFLQHLSRNQALLEYHNRVQEGLCSLFIQSKLAESKFKIDGATAATTTLQVAGEFIPEVGTILSKIATFIEYKNEKDIQARLKKISQLIVDEKKNIIAKYIASKLTI